MDSQNTPHISKALFVELLKIAGYTIVKEEPASAPTVTRFDLTYPNELETYTVYYIDVANANNAQNLMLFIINNVKDRAFHDGGVSKANAIKKLLNL